MPSLNSPKQLFSNGGNSLMSGIGSIFNTAARLTGSLLKTLGLTGIIATFVAKANTPAFVGAWGWAKSVVVGLGSSIGSSIGGIVGFFGGLVGGGLAGGLVGGLIGLPFGKARQGAAIGGFALAAIGSVAGPVAGYVKGVTKGYHWTKNYVITHSEAATAFNAKAVKSAPALVAVAKPTLALPAPAVR